MLAMLITPYRRNIGVSPINTWSAGLSWVDQLFKDNWDELLSSAQSGMGYDDKKKAYSTELNVAGYKQDEIKVELEDGLITITAENQKRGKAVRSFYVSDADPDKVEAKLENGVLTVTIPKRPEKLPKRIAIT